MPRRGVSKIFCPAKLRPPWPDWFSWGAFVVDQMGLQAPPGLFGIHTDMPAVVPAEIDKAAFAGEPAPSGPSADEKRAYEQLVATFKQVATPR
jgi:hypothetical protein